MFVISKFLKEQSVNIRNIKCINLKPHQCTAVRSKHLSITVLNNLLHNKNKILKLDLPRAPSLWLTTPLL